MTGLVWYLTSRIDREMADEFFDLLATGAELKKNNPILRLRERFIANHDARMKLQTPELAALTIKAWNYWRVGCEVQQLSWRFRGGDEFPDPQ